MKAYTNISQSKKLAEKLPLQSADMHYERVYFEGKKSDWFVALGPPIKSDDIIPCWSLAALLDILQNAARSIDEDGSVTLDSYKTVEWNLGINNSDLEFVTESNPVDAAFEMILKLKENNLL